MFRYVPTNDKSILKHSRQAASTCTVFTSIQQNSNKSFLLIVGDKPDVVKYIEKLYVTYATRNDYITLQPNS